MHVERHATANKIKQPLTDEQAGLVSENIGLVGVHLRRYVANLAKPCRDREREDLFQEGCLGLIDAAIRYRVERGIPFAAFALPRIHNAVSKALYTKFATVYVPPRRSKVDCRLQTADCGFEGAGQPSIRNPQSATHNRPTVRSLSQRSEVELIDRRRHNPEPQSGETIGERLRERYVSAVHTAARTISNKTSTRGDRDKLVRILTEERFLVPHDDARRPLRQIARDTQSSYARVAQCDKQMGVKIRRALETDPEFCELKRRMRTDPLGGDVPIDEEVEHDLVSASVDEFVRRFQNADTRTRAGVLHAVLEVSDNNIETLIRDRFGHLPEMTRGRLLAELLNTARPSAPIARADS